MFPCRRNSTALRLRARIFTPRASEADLHDLCVAADDDATATTSDNEPIATATETANQRDTDSLPQERPAYPLPPHLCKSFLPSPAGLYPVPNYSPGPFGTEVINGFEWVDVGKGVAAAPRA